MSGLGNILGGLGNIGIGNSGSGNIGIGNSGSGNIGIGNSGSGNIGIGNFSLGDILGAPKTPTPAALPPTCAPVEPPVCPPPPKCLPPPPQNCAPKALPACPPPPQNLGQVAKNPCGCKSPHHLGRGLNKQLGQSPDVGKLISMLQQLSQCLNMQGQAGQAQSPVKYLA